MEIPSYNLSPQFVVYPIEGLAVTFHLLYDDQKKETVLIDTGFRGELSKLERILRFLHLTWPDIKAILLTHGHLDHTGNLAEIKRLTRAPIYAHPLEQPHIDGAFPYQGASRWCGRLEAIGRKLLNYHSVPIDVRLSDGMDLPYWGGLKVIHLPGHTEGHCGFYSHQHRLLFTGDLFADYWFSAHLPFPFLNSCPQYLPTSLQKVRTLDPELVIPSHYTGFDAKQHKHKLDELIARYTS
jgi:glyoxylase-like metal-dependent hydrolase (beta-lactamase superfamily II)